MVKLPELTAAWREFPNLGRVWIKTLNEPEWREAKQAAHLYAGKIVMAYSVGEPLGEGLRCEFSDLTDTELIEWLVSALRPEMAMKAQERYPEIPAPIEEGGALASDVQSDDYLKRLQEWEAAQKAQNEEIKRFLSEAEAQTRTGYTAMSRENCVAEACRITRAQMRQTEFERRFILEVVCRAVRKEENSAELVFNSADALYDFPTTAQALWEAYLTLDSVKPNEIPT